MQQITSRRGKGAGRQKDMGLFTKMFGTRSEREVKKLSATVDKVMALEEPYKKLSDDELRAKTCLLYTSRCVYETGPVLRL